jgi:hypothetical protein
MGRRIVRFSVVAVLLLHTFFLITCNNKFDILDAIQTEVKAANDKFLVLKDFSPQNNDTDVNPGLTITMDFDRLLDETSINSTNIVFDPPISWNHSFNTSTKTLSVYPYPYLEGGIPYTLTVTKGLKGTDGSDIQEEVAWSFTTTTMPAGSVLMDDNDPYTGSTTVDLLIDANAEAKYVTYSFNEDFSGSAPRVLISAYPMPIPGVSLPAPTVEGNKRIYAKFDDGDGFVNELAIAHDDIGLDLYAPSVTNFAINKNADTTSSTRVTLYCSVSDASPVLMRFQNTGGSWSSWYYLASSKAWTLINSAGTRVVNAQFKDALDRVTSVSDAIINGMLTLTGATLNSTTVGTVTATWSGASPADTGTDYYRVYRRDYPSGATYTYEGQTTGSSLNVTVPVGQLYYIQVAIYSTGVGTLGPYSDSKLAYTSDIAIIYDSYDSTDTTIANDMKTILTTDIPSAYSPTVGGTMPSWSVTLVPQSVVPTTYSSANVFHGYPVIITPGNDLYANANQTRNVVAHGHGVFAMGTGGTRLLDTCEDNWGSWGLVGTAPTEIGWMESGSASASSFMYTWTSGNSVWNSPLNSTAFPGGTTPTHNAQTQISYASISRISVYRGSDTNPTDGWLYGRENSPTSHYYPVVRQGRFLQFGFQQETDRYYTGWVYITNLVYRMSAAYF